MTHALHLEGHDPDHGEEDEDDRQHVQARGRRAQATASPGGVDRGGEHEQPPSGQLGGFRDLGTGDRPGHVPEGEEGDDERRRHDRPASRTAVQEREHGERQGGSDEAPHERRRRVDRQHLIEVRGVQEQDAVRSEQERVHGEPGERRRSRRGTFIHR